MFCPHVCLHTTYVPGVLGDQKRALDLLELGSQLAVNPMWVLWKGSQSPYLLNRLSSSSKTVCSLKIKGQEVGDDEKRGGSEGSRGR